MGQHIQSRLSWRPLMAPKFGSLRPDISFMPTDSEIAEAKLILTQTDMAKKKSHMASMTAWLKKNKDECEANATALQSRGEDRQSYLVKCLCYQKRKGESKMINVKGQSHTQAATKEYEWLDVFQLRSKFGKTKNRCLGGEWQVGDEAMPLDRIDRS